jgi:hypothetical protein
MESVTTSLERLRAAVRQLFHTESNLLKNESPQLPCKKGMHNGLSQSYAGAGICGYAGAGMWIWVRLGLG